MTRRTILKQSATAVACLAGSALSSRPVVAKGSDARPMIHTVLGPVAPEKLGATLMHEHAPIVDWSELYETAPAPVAPVREKMLAETALCLTLDEERLPRSYRNGLSAL